MLVRFRSKHVCTPGARRNKTPAWKRAHNKTRVVASVQLPIDYVSEPKVKKRKPIDPAKYAASDKVAKSSAVKYSNIPRVTVSCGGVQMTRKNSLTEQDVTKLNERSVID
jgi:hypothetical protein